MFKLAVSIVIYKHNVDEIFSVVSELFESVVYSCNTYCQVIIVDNHGSFDWSGFKAKACSFDESIFSIKLISNPQNKGYGFGNNLALEESNNSDYFLVLNPDAFLEKDSLAKSLCYMEQNNNCVLLAPNILSKNGYQESGVKEFPSVLVLLARLLNITIVNRLLKKQLERYEAKYVFSSIKPIDVSIISGCFMLFNTKSLQSIGGFDTRFFMYFEDFDLSLRAKEIGRIVYHPDVKITHLGGGAGRKGLNHIKYFTLSMFKFFDKHGWRII